MYQLSQSVREPPPSVTENASFSDGISQRCFARVPSIAHAERLQQVFRRIVLAMLVLDAGENRELAARPEVHFELRHAVDDVVVDALGVPPGRGS